MIGMTNKLVVAMVALMLVTVGARRGAADDRTRRASLGPCTNVNVSVDEQHQKVVVAFSNHCESKTSCAVSWSLRCGKGASEPKSERVSIEGHSESQLEASALACGDVDWRITPPRWRCEEQGTQAESLTTTHPRHRH